MSQAIALVSLLVTDYDEAIAFYTQALRFELLEDTAQADGKRWVVVAPPSAASGPLGAQLLLARASNARQRRQVGDQAGGRGWLFLHSDDFWAHHRHMLAHGVRFAEGPREQTYGTVAVFLDLYGNRWDLIQRRSA